MANSSTRTLLLEEAARRGWQTETFGLRASFLKVTLPDGRWELFSGAQPRRNSVIGNNVSKNKQNTLDFVTSLGYRVPQYAVVETEQQILDFLKSSSKIVLKPVDGKQSEGVTVNVETPEQALAAFAYAQRHSPAKKVIAQQHVDGKLYRLLVLDGKMVAATWRPGSSVTGDGIHTVEELITELNLDPRRGERADLALKMLDAPTAAAFLGDEVFYGIPEAGQEVVVSRVDTVAGGGAVNVTDQVHADWQNFATSVAADLGLFICGFDIICHDISQPGDGDYVPLLEINAAPGLRMHESPSEGQAIHVAPLLYNALFSAN